MTSFFKSQASTNTDRDSLAAQLAIGVQQSGYLLKKRFSKGGKQGAWQRRYFVLKDGFLLWYSDRKKQTATFDPHPKGCLPLGGSTIRVVRGHSKKGEEENRAFEVSHPDFNGSLLLAAEDEAQAADWRRVLNDARRVTWENALLGDAFIEQLEAKGTELQRKTEEALEKAQREADRVRKELEEKRILQEKASALETAAEAARTKEEEIESIAKAQAKSLEAERERLQQLEHKAGEVEGALEEERVKRQLEEAKRREVEEQLQEAEKTLLKLEHALKVSQRKSGLDEEINLSVNALKQFFHDKIEEQHVATNATGIVREGLTEKAKYKKDFGVDANKAVDVLK